MRSHLEVALDFGSSLTKGIYQLNSGNPQLLIMSPKVVGTTSFGLQSTPTNGFLKTHTNLSPETEAWVKWGKEETYYAVGQLAEQLSAPEGLKILKWQRAIPKLLPALWVIKQRHSQEFS